MPDITKCGNSMYGKHQDGTGIYYIYNENL